MPLANAAAEEKIVRRVAATPLNRRTICASEIFGAGNVVNPGGTLLAEAFTDRGMQNDGNLVVVISVNAAKLAERICRANMEKQQAIPFFTG